MTKLLAAYRANPSLANAQKVRAYERKHPFALTLLSRDDADLVADAIHRANGGHFSDCGCSSCHASRLAF
jgi:hypothetical protein